MIPMHNFIKSIINKSMLNMIKITTLLNLTLCCMCMCLTNYKIKNSKEECVFHYAAKDALCNHYEFTHCDYYTNSTTHWLWIFRDKIIPTYYDEAHLQKCSMVCCKGNLSLPIGINAIKICQEYKFTQEIISPNMIEKIFQATFLLILLSLLFVILYQLFTMAEGFIQNIRGMPQREIEMQML